ncbi:MAG: hypothetical protein SNJ53_02270 [Thermodesulfovibrionales bacterium]
MIPDYTQWLWAFVGAVIGILSVGVLIFIILVIKEIRVKKLKHRRLLIRLDTARSMLKEDMPFDALKIYQEIDKLVDPIDDQDLYIEIKKGEGECYLSLYNKTGKTDFLENAISSFEKVINLDDTQEVVPDLADVRLTLGTLYIKKSDQRDKEKNLKKAIHHLDTSLKTFAIQGVEPQRLAYINSLLGKAYYDTILDGDVDGIKKAIDYNEDALLFYTYENYPIHYAEISAMLGDLYNALSDKENKMENLARAMGYYKQSLAVYSSDDFLKEFGEIQLKLAEGYIKISKIEDKNRHLMNAIVSYQDALRYYTMDKDPKTYADIHKKLADIYESFASNSKEREEILENLTRARDALKNAIFILEKERLLEDLADQMSRFADIVLKEYEHIKSDKLLKEALDYYKKAADIRTKDKYPFEYAVIKKKIGDVYKIIARVTNWSENMVNARQSYVDSLKVFTIDKYPFWYKEVKTAMDEIDRLAF